MDRKQALALWCIEDSVRSLIELYCTEQPTEAQIAGWFSGINFEALRPEVSCMAAAVSTLQSYAGVPKELIPRLRGIMKYVHTLNSGMTAGLLSLGKQCNQAQLPVMLLGGTAIHFSNPNPPRRHMWRMEIGISEDRFAQVVELAKETGFAVEQTPYSATARSGNTQCIFIRKGTESPQNASPLTVSGVSFLLPCSADLLVSFAQTAFETLFTMESGIKLLPWLMDFHCLVEGKPDWKAVAAVAKERSLSAQVRLILELYCTVAPSSAVEAALPLFGTEAQSAKLGQLLLKYRKPGCSALKRRWLSGQIRTGASPLKALWLGFRRG